MNVKFLLFETYLETIKRSVGSNLFQITWGEVDGEKRDLTNKGQYSCAAHVSSILLWFSEYGLIKMRHVGVSGLVKDMEKCGWHKIDTPKEGCIIQWEGKLKNDEMNEHIGFYIGEDRAISNERDAGTPIEHHYTYEGKRKIEAMYWHHRLDE